MGGPLLALDWPMVFVAAVAFTSGLLTGFGLACMFEVGESGRMISQVDGFQPYRPDDARGWVQCGGCGWWYDQAVQGDQCPVCRWERHAAEA